MLIGKLFHFLHPENCPTCQQKLRYLGEDQHYAKFAYYVCHYENCEWKNALLQYRHGKFDTALSCQILKEENNHFYLYHKETGEQFWKELV